MALFVLFFFDLFQIRSVLGPTRVRGGHRAHQRTGSDRLRGGHVRRQAANRRGGRRRGRPIGAAAAGRFG